MEKIKVINRKRLPTRLPVMPTALTYLLLDTYSAPGWLWGGLATLFVFLWIGCIFNIFFREEEES